MNKAVAAASFVLDVHHGRIKHNARISVARPVDMGIDRGVLAAEVAKFVAAAERRQARQRGQRARRRVRAAEAAATAGVNKAVAAASCLAVRDGRIRRNARISVAKPVDMGIDRGMLAEEVAKFVAAAERRQARQRARRARRRVRAAEAAAAAGMNKAVAVASCLAVRDGGIRRNARISVARPVDLGIDSGVLAEEVAKFVAAAERRQARQRARRARRRAHAAAAVESATGSPPYELSDAAEERSAAAGQEAGEGAERMQVEEAPAPHMDVGVS